MIMDFEKIKLALALKNYEMRILVGGDMCIGYLEHMDTSDGHGYKVRVMDKNGQRFIRVGKNKDIVAKKLYEWVNANRECKQEVE